MDIQGVYVSKLTTEIRLKGLYCKDCSNPMDTTSIDETEAKKILKLLKDEFTDAIRRACKTRNMNPREMSESDKSYNDGIDDAIRAVWGVE